MTHYIIRNNIIREVRRLLNEAEELRLKSFEEEDYHDVEKYVELVSKARKLLNQNNLLTTK